MTDYKRETLTLIKRYFKGDPDIGFEALKVRVHVLRRNKEWNVSLKK